MLMLVLRRSTAASPVGGGVLRWCSGSASTSRDSGAVAECAALVRGRRRANSAWWPSSGAASPLARSAGQERRDRPALPLQLRRSSSAASPLAARAGTRSPPRLPPAQTRGLVVHLPLIGAVGLSKAVALLAVKKVLVVELIRRYGVKETFDVLRKVNDELYKRSEGRYAEPAYKAAAAGIDALELGMVKLEPAEQIDVLFRWLREAEKSMPGLSAELARRVGLEELTKASAEALPRLAGRIDALGRRSCLGEQPSASSAPAVTWDESGQAAPRAGTTASSPPASGVSAPDPKKAQ